jgi:hypothetical protein
MIKYLSMSMKWSGSSPQILKQVLYTILIPSNPNLVGPSVSLLQKKLTWPILCGIILGSNLTADKNMSRYSVWEYTQKGDHKLLNLLVGITFETEFLRSLTIVICTDRNTKNGQEERYCQKSAVRGDPGMYLHHLLRQDGNPDHQPNVCL